ncbi:Retrovirus-related Pol polyprotein from transposon TNT 1-94 [Vitis vinifera]|uniref:Retrovirus-related Pol polyprotein from transposon TNT 1-94 n=1 Tax=Vitis vinifera TaxID=29760 RepID=A0A438CD56_VITVI|nr:Retrovirus-related Pol polyprotein from transposon TNT 1-94 [Vitis vinifera]
MKEEMKSMKDNGVWDLVELPEGTPSRKRFHSKEDIDYKETFSPVSSNDSFRIIMALVAHYVLELHQMDVKTAFLNGNIDETIYMVQQENSESNDSKQLVITSFGFKENTVDQCIYLKFSGSKFIILVLYVDDILIASSDVGLLHETKRFLSSKFDMKDLGDASFVLGDKFSLHQCPKNELEKKDMERFPNASAIGSLMYAQVCTRPDIVYIVGMLSRYLSNPGMDHYKKAKRVIRYLQRTKDYMLTYRRSSHLEIVGYSDSDFVGYLDSRRSTLGYVFMLAGGVVSWKSVKQTLIVSSTMEAEFISCYKASNHGIWLRNFITQLRIIDGLRNH